MTKVPETHGAIVGCMATFPARFGVLRRTIGSIAPQLDRLYLYVNETTEGLPELSDLGDIVVLDGREHVGDLLANGKVYPLQYIHDCSVFSLDDDFIFPADYVAKNLALLRKFGGRCLVTTHGSVIPPRADWYYERSKVFMSTRKLECLQICNLAGSGTMCFDQRVLRIDLEDLLQEVMVDLKISIAARAAEIPIFVLPRPEGWLENIPMEGLWQKFSKGSLTPHTYVAREVDWSFIHYSRIAHRAMVSASVTAEEISMDPELASCIQTGSIPAHWQVTPISLQTRERYLDLLAGMMEQC